MKNVKLERAKHGGGWFLDIDDTLCDLKLTAKELWEIYKAIEDNIFEIEKEM